MELNDNNAPRPEHADGNEGQARDDGERRRDSLLPPIEPEVDDRIHVGAGGSLIVPREDIGEDLDVGEDLDLAAMQSKKVRKPNRREWFVLNPASELPTRLLLHKPNPDGIETEYYHVAKGLRLPIVDELKPCRVFVYYSQVTKTTALWIVNVTIGNSWYESLAPLFKKPAEFFSSNAIRVIPLREPHSKYKVKYKAMPNSVTWPTKKTSELLGEALGPDKFISTPDHPLYRDLIDGIELT